MSAITNGKKADINKMVNILYSGEVEEEKVSERVSEKRQIVE